MDKTPASEETLQAVLSVLGDISRQLGGIDVKLRDLNRNVKENGRKIRNIDLNTAVSR